MQTGAYIGNDAVDGLPPVGSSAPRLLILGSLPGVRSLDQRQYYAHPQNQFWHLLGSALGEPLAQLSYAERLRRLSARGVALWDVVARAHRTGSLDQTIRHVTINPVQEFCAGMPQLRSVAFNGLTAARLGRRALAQMPALALCDLPSSSAAYTLPLAQKQSRWALLGQWLQHGPP
jgi:double-stranded uracil-DNA glycosylase